MNITIFSKDRACQLELFIRTMRRHFKEFSNHKINVIVKYKDDTHRIAYDILQKENKDINLIFQNGQELSFKQLTINSIDPSEKYTVFFVDDISFKNNFSIFDHQFSMMGDPTNMCVSLRMNRGMSYCQTARITYTKIPEIKDNRWAWRNEQGDWGYPMSLDGHIFRTDDILPIITSIPYNNPTYMESEMSGNIIPREFIICYENAIIFNNPINRVHNFNMNPCGNISEDFLAVQYINGKRIQFNVDLSTINFISPHFEVPIICV